MSKSENILPDIDKTIHELARLKIMATLDSVAEGDMTFLMNFTGLSWGNLSVQVSKLKDAGFVAVEKSFVDNKPQSRASLTKQGKQALKKYKSAMSDLLGF